MKVYVGLQKNFEGGVIVDSWLVDAGDTNASYLNLVDLAQEKFSDNDEVVRYPICNTVMIFDVEKSAINAVRKGCVPCSCCSK